MSRRRCCCCSDVSYTPPQPFHRDMTTGDPWPDDESLDGQEILFELFDGDTTGLSQETITHNCTVGAVTVSRVTGGFDDGQTGYLNIELADIVPDDPASDAFAALQVLWTGETFDAFAHKSHVARGALLCSGVQRHGAGNTIPLGGSGSRPWMRAGVIVRSNGLLFVTSLVVNAMANFPGDTAPIDSCWDSLLTGATQVLENGILRNATVAELRENGLTVDPIATQKTHEVGFFFGLLPYNLVTPSGLADTYTVSWDFDTISIVARYFLDCEAAFCDLSQLTLSTPSHTGTSNVEPVELRGLAQTLTLTTMPAWPGDVSLIRLQAVYEHGYAYFGSFSVATGSATVAISVWYVPCDRLVFRFDDGGTCPLWIVIEHDDVFSDDFPPGVSGDNASGTATAPAFSGGQLRDVKWPPNNKINTTLGVQWYGSDCVGLDCADGFRVVNGYTGKCCGSALPPGPPTCVAGVLPNQLDWISDCYSLDPIAIGYRRRVSDVYVSGSPGNCTTAPTGPSQTNVCDAGPGGAHDATTECTLTHLLAMGFSASLEIRLAFPPGIDAMLLYFDISE